MTRARLCVIAGLTGIAAMTGADASAQDCPGWLKWACPDSAPTNAAVSQGVRREKQLPPTTAASGSAMGRTKQAGSAAGDAATAQQTQASARPAKAVRRTHSGASSGSGDRRLARHEEGRGTRLDPAMNDQEREALFQQFLKWEKARRLNAETNP
jgi:hypothetical protein